MTDDDFILEARGAMPAGVDMPVGLDARVGKGDILALTGRDTELLNACFHTLAGTRRLAAGYLHIAGIDLHDLDERDWLALRQRSGLISSRVPLLSTMSAGLNVMLPMLYHRTRDAGQAQQVADELLDQLGFRADHHALPSELDETDQLRAQLARELILDPDIIFVDEPFSLRSVGDWPLISGLLKTLAGERNIAFVIATANLAFIGRHAQQSIYIGAQGCECLDTGAMLSGAGSEDCREFLKCTTTWARELSA